MKTIAQLNKPVILFFILYFLLGTLIFKNYGISWDEPYQRQIGYVSLEYIRGDTSLLSFTDRYYGVIFELPLVIIERVANIEDTRIIYLFRHYATFLLFYAGVIVFYLLNTKLFKSWKLGLVACSFLLLNPRIFADSFYNSKDIPLLVFYIFSTYTTYQFVTEKKKTNFFLHSLASALVINTRVVGLIIPAVTTLFLLVSEPKKNIKKLVYYLTTTSIFTYLFWPVLWTNPLRIFEAIATMANFSYQKNLPTLYLGEFVSTFSLPWHYLPVWIGSTLPISFSILFLLGLLKAFFEYKQGTSKKLQENSLLLVLMCVPILSAIFLGSTLYDGWRHFYFIYPLMVVFMIKGVQILPKKLLLIVGIELLLTISFMIKNHPHQQVYFTSIFRNNFETAKQLFELDYWGLSYRQALEYVTTTDPSDEIKIVVANNPGNSNALILPKVDRDRIQFLSIDELNKADYFISNYRWHPNDYNYQSEVFSEVVSGAKIIVVYKLH